MLGLIQSALRDLQKQVDVFNVRCTIDAILHSLFLSLDIIVAAGSLGDLMWITSRCLGTEYRKMAEAK